MNNKRSYIIAPIVLLVIVAAFVMLSRSRPPRKAPVTQTSVQQKTGIPVYTSDIKVASVNDALSVTGQLAAESVTNLSTKVPGKVLYVAAQEGDSVRKGQVVIQLDDSDARRQLDQALAGVQQAQAAIRTAQTRLASARTTASVGDVTSRTAVAQAKAGLSAAKARLQELRTGARRQERIQAQNQVAIAKANLDKAQSDYNRYNQLYQQGAIAAATLDIYNTSLNVAKSQYNNAVQAASLTEEGARTEDIRQAEAAVQQAQQQLAAAQASQQTNINRQQDVQAALAGVNQARAGLASAQAAVGIAEQNVDNFKIRSPRNGSVTSRNVEPGQYANPGTPLLTIVDLSTVYLQADVSETDIQRVRTGMPVEVKVDAFGNRTWPGRVESVIASADPAARTFTARVAVANPDHRLRPNMFARADIITGRVTNAMLVPREAVLQRDGKNMVVKVEGDKETGQKAVVVPVSTGITSGDRIVVRSPELKPSDRIVISGQQDLTTGQKVMVATT